MLREDRIEGFLLLMAAALTILGLIAWFSHEIQGYSKISSKWPETRSTTSCTEYTNPDGSTYEVCTTTYYQVYFVQLTDGEVFNVPALGGQWDRMMPGSCIHFSARGYLITVFGQRVQEPTIFWWDASCG